MTMLIAMSGLPGSGKSAVAEALGRQLPAPVLSVDPIEAAMWRAGIDRAQPTGLAAYVVVDAIAASILGRGQPVVVDAVNDVPEARAQWRALAARTGVPLRWIEVTCSDPRLHRQRLETRRRDIEGFYEPTWESVQARRAGFDGWTDERLVLDSTMDLKENVRAALDYLTAPAGPPEVH